MNAHALAEIFPELDGEDFDRLVADIQARGQIEPITLTSEGAILDGRNRWRACEQLGKQPITRVYEGEEPLGYVLSLNLHRRHLNESQRAMVAAKLANMKAHRPADNSANLQTSQADAAALLNVSTRTVASAAKVRNEGTPELIQAVERGVMSVSSAAQVATAPAEVQRAIVADTGRLKIAMAADEFQKITRPHVAENSGENEWYTPLKFIEAARAAMGGIELDPASCEMANETVGASDYFDIEIDGLEQEWHGRIWMNPPYAQPLIAQFCAKLISEFKAGRASQACALVNNGTETAWGQGLLIACDAVCFPSSRIKFNDTTGEPTGAPLQGQMIVYLGNYPDLFAEAYADIGVVLRG